MFIGIDSVTTERSLAMSAMLPKSVKQDEPSDLAMVLTAAVTSAGLTEPYLIAAANFPSGDTQMTGTEDSSEDRFLDMIPQAASRGSRKQISQCSLCAFRPIRKERS